MLPEPGLTITTEKVLHQADLDRFASLTGDDNPIHVDPEFSSRTRFGRTVAHGMLLYGLICGLLSNHFPGARQLEQNFMFPAPTFTGEALTVQVHAAELLPQERRARLTTVIAKADGEIVCDGETLLEWPES